MTAGQAITYGAILREFALSIAINSTLPIDLTVLRMTEAGDRAETGNERVILTRNGKLVTAAVPPSGVAALADRCAPALPSTRNRRHSGDPEPAGENPCSSR
jgi:hypothetical protein